MEFLKNFLNHELATRYPFWQAPLPFDLISPTMAGQISEAGGLGFIRIAEHHHANDVERFTTAYRQYSDHLNYCFAHRLPENYPKKQALPHEKVSSFEDLLEFVLGQNPKVIAFMHGIPDRKVIARIKSHGILTVAMVKNMLEALACESFGIDALVLQGIEAGGERVGFQNDLPDFPQSGFSLLQQARQTVKLPLVLWSDLATGVDVLSALLMGAQAVMVDRPFLACKECQLPEHLRQKVIHATEFDSVISSQFTIKPLRYLQGELSARALERVNLPDNKRITIEASWEQVFHVNDRPLAVSLTAIDDPIDIQHYFQKQVAEIEANSSS